METLDRLCSMLGAEVSEAVAGFGDALQEVRLRAGQPVQLCAGQARALVGGPVSGNALARIATALMNHSLYALERELREGYFTLPDGCRVGVCGQMAASGALADAGAVGSLCVRLARELRGCAGALHDRVTAPDGRLTSLLILSRPGMGKTTLLRDLARLLSLDGRRVAIADERHELAACVRGTPALDVGPCADVLDGVPKARAMTMLVRAMAPEVIVTDEIGSAEDAAALREAIRCGAAVIASAHASGLRDALLRRDLAATLGRGCFEQVALLGDSPGRVKAVYDVTNGEAGHAFCAGAVRGGGLHAVRKVAGRRTAASGGAAGVAVQGAEAFAASYDRYV